MIAYGTILRRNWDNLVVMAVAPGTEEGIPTTEGIPVYPGFHLVVVLSKGAKTAYSSYWPVYGTGALDPATLQETLNGTPSEWEELS